MNETVQAEQRQLLTMPDAGRLAVIQFLAQAKRSVAVKIYSLTDQPVVAALEEAVQRGCDVRVLFNPKRGDGTRDNDDIFEQLKAAGAQVRWASTSFVATHEKSITVDESISLIASFNFGEKYFSQTRDYGILTRDPRQVEQILACFDADWAGQSFKPAAEVGLLWGPGFARRAIADLIAGAKHTIDIQQSKFVDAVVVLRLAEALGRGIKVRIVCAGRQGLHAWDRPETLASLRSLQHLGAHVHRMKHPKTHGNLLIVDGRTAQIGSLHIHHVAYDARRELGIQFDDRSVVHALMTRYEADWYASERYKIPDPLDDTLVPVDPDIWQV